MKQPVQKTNWNTALYKILYEADTTAGRWFDIALIIAILYGIVLEMLESVVSFNLKYHNFINNAELGIIVLFTLEYFARILVIKKSSNYIFSFYGIIAIQTGIVTSAMTRQDLKIHINTQSCPHCLADNHIDNAEFCHQCGKKLNDE